MTTRKRQPRKTSSSTKGGSLVRRVPKRPATPAPIIEDDGRDLATEYAQAVVDGREVAGPHVRAACTRHLRDLRDGPKRGLTWDLQAARKFYRFCSVLRLHQAEFYGKPFVLHPAQHFITGNLFGWKKGEYRRFRRAFIEMGKGNGKSPLAAAIGLYGLIADDEAAGQIFAAASNEKQARIVFDAAVAMVQQVPKFAERIVFAGKSNVTKLTWKADRSYFTSVSREAGPRGSGFMPSMALCDEIHEHPNRTLVDMLERGFKIRRQPLLFMITNSGSDPQSFAGDEHLHAIKVAHGDVDDDEHFSYVCALDDGEDPLKDHSCHKKVNPLLGMTLKAEDLARAANEARMFPGKQNEILRLHFCQWTNAETAWISREAWAACEDPTLNIEDFVGRRCFAGLDLSETTDLTAKVLVFEDGVTDDGKPKYAAFSHGYTPADTLHARVKKERIEYDRWVKDGELTATPGSVIQLDYVARDLVQDSQRFELVQVAYDRWQINRFEKELDHLGVKLPLIEHAQGDARRRGCPPDCPQRHEHRPEPLWMPGSINELEALILQRRIRFHVSRCLRTNVASARFHKTAGGNRRFLKNKVKSRIDLCVALAMGVGAAVGNAAPSTGHASGRLIVVY